MPETCKTCRNWRQDPEYQNAEHGECHKSQATGVEVSRPPPHVTMETKGWEITEANHWCPGWVPV